MRYCAKLTPVYYYSPSANVGNTTITMTTNAIDYDRINASLASAFKPFSNAMQQYYRARQEQREALRRQQQADNSTVTTEVETLTDSQGSDGVVSDTSASARASRKRKNSNDGSGGSDGSDDGSTAAAEKKARSIPTTALATTPSANESSDGRGGHAIVLCNIDNNDESSSNNKENNATISRGGNGENGENEKGEINTLSSCNYFTNFSQQQTFHKLLFTLNFIILHRPLLYHSYYQFQTMILLQKYNNHERMNHSLPFHLYNNHHCKIIITIAIAEIIMDNNQHRIVTEIVNLHRLEEHLHRHLHCHLHRQAVQLLPLLKMTSNVS